MPGHVVVRLGRRLRLAREPLLKFVHWFGNHEESHVRVLRPAKLGALSAKGPFLIYLEPDRRLVARNKITLALQVRRPEAVDHVARTGEQHDWLAGRHMNLIGCGHPHAGMAVRILHLPPPLMAYDLNGD